jgi:hypothetical protein
MCNQISVVIILKCLIYIVLSLLFHMMPPNDLYMSCIDKHLITNFIISPISKDK